MICFTSLFLALWATTQVDGRNLKIEASSLKLEGDIETPHRQLLPTMLAGYQPSTTVSDYAAIDRDQKIMQNQLERESDEGFNVASAIYKEGGHSKSYAVIDLDRSPDTYVLKNIVFEGLDSSGRPVKGRTYLTQQRNRVQLRYEALDGLEGMYPDCNVGGLTEIGAEETDRCFAETGRLTTTISGQRQTFGYSYNVLTDNFNARTLQGFSRLVATDMINCVRCPYPDVGYAVDYYGVPSYSNLWIEAAFDRKSTPYERGNADFSDWGHVGRAESIKIGAVTMNTFMYVLREFEDAIGDCLAGDIEAVSNWDEGVALYTGSLEGPDGSPRGRLLHQMADDHCSVFKTCGIKGNDIEGVSKLNLDMLALFEQGQRHLLSFDCKPAEETKNKIANLMYVPLIQGVLNAAYRIEFLDGYQREQGQGAAFAAAVLPRVHFADPNAAKIIYKNMKVGAPSTSHREVKEAFRSVYRDLNIDCLHIGGMWNKAAGTYYKGGNTCDVTKTEMTVLILSAIAGSILFALTGAFFYYRGRNHDEY